MMPSLLGVVLTYLTQDQAGRRDFWSRVSSLRRIGTAWFALILALFIAGPLTEELGWRGFALDRLLARWDALLASVIFGTAWTLWRLPLIFTLGMPQYGMGGGAPGFWMFLANLISVSVIITWVYYPLKLGFAAAAKPSFRLDEQQHEDKDGAD